MNPTEYHFSEAPFFIFGCGRSGTSLLSRMLNHHPRLAVPYESHILNTFAPLIDRYGDLGKAVNRERLVADILSTDVMRDWQPRVAAEDVLARLPENSLGGVFEAILSSWMQACGKQRWGEKTPHHVDHWGTIARYWPRAKIIHIYRDGRDVALSLKRARFGPKTIFACAQYWVRYLDKVEKLQRALPAQTLHAVSYENLLAAPELELEKICRFLGETFTPEMLRFHENQAAYKTDNQNRRNLARPIMQDNTGKWQRHMRPSDLRIFEAIAAPKLDRYGYSRAIEDPRMAPWEQAFQGKLLSPLKKTLAMARNRKGHRDSLIKLKIRLKLLFRR